LGAGLTLGAQGATEDEVAAALDRLVLMGGGPEVDGASREFVEGAGGGDVLVLRASGSVDSYTPYFYDELGAEPAPASSKTIRTDDPGAGDDPALLCHLLQSEALWLAGGDQWDYLGLWPSPLHQALHEATGRGMAIGGTSAGAMALGEMTFNAEVGSITSATALEEPTHFAITLSASPFFHPALKGVLVDTHFADRDREGRLLVFLARGRQLLGLDSLWGVGMDEHAALIIEGGTYRVHPDSTGSVHLYHYSGTATVEEGVALSMNGVFTQTLTPGSTGTWPPNPEAPGMEPLQVANGTIVRP
jgi:cyanophycinase-like exopeptidase